MLSNVSLVLDGGGMRGVFTAGALDCLLDSNVYLPYVVGVSAGSSNGLSYASRQKGRAKFCNIDILRKRNYIGVKYLFTQRCIMDYRFLFGDLPRKIYPYDFSAYLKSGIFKFVVTNCLTGKAEYIEKPKTFDEVLNVCRASCSLPYACPICKIDGVPFMDGGISDAIPVRRAIADGFGKHVIILTRNKGYRKSSMYSPIAKLLYRKYPNFVDCLKTAHEKYNENLDYAESLEAEGKAVVIRPLKKLTIDRLERNPDNLEPLYKHGYECCRAVLDKIYAL